MSDRYVPLGYAAPPAPPMRGYVDPNAPQPYYQLPATPPIPQDSVDPYGAYGAAQPLPYDPNAAPTRSWDLAPSNVITPMDPNRGKSLDEITPMRGWRGY